MERLTFDKDDDRRDCCPIKFDIDEEDTISKFCDNVCDEWEDNCPFAVVGKRLQAYEDTNLTSEQILEIDRAYREKCEELAKYQQLEEDGLLLRLPCKLGTEVYVIEDDCNGDVFDCSGDCEHCREHFRGVGTRTFSPDMLDAIGKGVFLTKEEAEQALAKMKEV